MGGNGTKGASAKTTTVQIDREFNHVECRNAFRANQKNDPVRLGSLEDKAD